MSSTSSADRSVVILSDDPRLESLAEFAAGAGHELNNPVATIVGRVQLLLQTETDPQRRHALETIAGQAYRIRDMISDVMLFARPPALDLQDCDLSDAVAAVIEVQRDRSAETADRLRWQSAEEPVLIRADSDQLDVVVSELVTNALEADSEGGPVEVRVTGSEEAVLEVRDVGPGLSESDRRHLFDPFYSGRQAGRGLGFGLPKCWRIVTLHGGRIAVEPLEPKGLCVRVHWPVAAGSGQAADAA